MVARTIICLYSQFQNEDTTQAILKILGEYNLGITAIRVDSAESRKIIQSKVDETPVFLVKTENTIKHYYGRKALQFIRAIADKYPDRRIVEEEAEEEETVEEQYEEAEEEEEGEGEEYTALDDDEIGDDEIGDDEIGDDEIGDDDIEDGNEFFEADVAHIDDDDDINVIFDPEEEEPVQSSPMNKIVKEMEATRKKMMQEHFPGAQESK